MLRTKQLKTVPKLLVLVVLGVFLWVNFLVGGVGDSRLLERDTWDYEVVVGEGEGVEGVGDVGDVVKKKDNLGDVFNSTLGFQKIFAINLPSRSDRRDALALAAAVSNISLEFVDGMRGEEVDDKALLPIIKRVVDREVENGAIGCWASHVKTLTEIVMKNITSALIFEDDIDWDIRLKSQLRDFALSSRSLSQSKPLKGDLNFDEIPIPDDNTTTSFISPYGDDWDVLHLGHCGMQFSNSPRIVKYQDPSVPELRHLTGWNANGTPLKIYPHHTRVVTRGLGGVCAYAYAVSWEGARRLLYEVAVKQYDLFDNAMARFCDGEGAGKGARCRSVVPTLFDAWGKGRDSDISLTVQKEWKEGGWRGIGEGGSANLRWSVRGNLDRLLVGRDDYVDQFPDRY